MRCRLPDKCLSYMARMLLGINVAALSARVLPPIRSGPFTYT